MMRLLLFACQVLVYKAFVETAMTESQLQAAVKIVRNVCQPRTKASDADIDRMHAGDWDIDYTAKCYMACGLAMNKLITQDNDIAYDVAVALMNKQLPKARLAPTMKSLEHCNTVGRPEIMKNKNDRCELGYAMAKCFYLSNPEVSSKKDIFGNPNQNFGKVFQKGGLMKKMFIV